MRAGRHRAEDRDDSGPDECTLAERVTAHGDFPNGVARETPLAGIGLDRHLIAREAREPPGDPDSRLIFNPKLIVEVDPKREVVERLKRLSRALRRYRQHEGNERGESRSAQAGARPTTVPDQHGNRADGVEADRLAE
jgi:hypothetical protein